MENERTLAEKIDYIREEMKGIAQTIWEMRTDAIMANAIDKESQGEIIANLTLSYRALEDASMRLGKIKNYL